MDWLPETEFWANEFTPGLTVPSRIEDMILYELHINALGAGQNRTGDLVDAMELIPYLSDLGVNAVELLPMAEFSGGFGWGYGDSHHFTVESSAGGRDEYKHFVRACHQRGIAVISVSFDIGRPYVIPTCLVVNICSETLGCGDRRVAPVTCVAR